MTGTQDPGFYKGIALGVFPVSFLNKKKAIALHAGSVHPPRLPLYLFRMLRKGRDIGGHDFPGYPMQPCLAAKLAHCKKAG